MAPSLSTAGRRWCLPPALVDGQGEHLEAMIILRELEGDLAVLLWSTWRDVRLWGSIPPDQRAGLFAPGAAAHREQLLHANALDDAIEFPLDVLTGMVAAPAQADPAALSVACVHVAEWSARQGLFGTATAFAQAAALAAPEHGEPPLLAGVLATQWGRDAVAETWLRRAVAVARREPDWQVYAAAFVELGALFTRRGSYEQAHRSFHRALLTCRRHGLRDIRARAFHGQMRLALRLREYERAEALARNAEKAFGPSHPQLSALLADQAVLKLRQRKYAEAGPLLRQVLRRASSSAERGQLLAALAHAAAGAGEQETYQECWATCWTLLEKGLEPAVEAAMVAELGRAAVAMHDGPRIAQAAERARQAAPATGRPALNRTAWRLPEEEESEPGGKES